MEWTETRPGCWIRQQEALERTPLPTSALSSSATFHGSDQLLARPSRALARVSADQAPGHPRLRTVSTQPTAGLPVVDHTESEARATGCSGLAFNRRRWE